MLKAHVDFKGSEREVSFEKGDKVIKLRHLVIVAFSDKRLDGVPPDMEGLPLDVISSTCLTLYDESHVPLSPDSTLEKSVKVKAQLPSTKEDMVRYTLR